MIFKYLNGRDWGIVAAITVFICIQVWMELTVPDYMYNITTLLQTGGTTGEILDEGLWMLGLSFGSLIISIITGYMAAYVATSLAMRLRSMQFAKVQSFSMNEMNGFSTPSLITRSTNDITQIQMFFAMGLIVMIRAPIMAIYAIYKIMNKSWEWTSATAVAIVVMVVIISILMFFAVPKFKKIQWLTDDVNRNMRENLSGLRVVRAYNAESYQEKKFEVSNENLTSNNLFVGHSMALMFPLMTLVMSVLSLSIYWIGAYLIAAETVTVQIGLFSDMVVFLSYAMQVVMAFIMLIIIFMILPRAIVSAKRVEEVINTESSVRDGPVTESPGVSGEIEFKNVSFSYQKASEKVVQDISFTAKKGETVAIIGSTGCGKTTVAKLLMRFHDVTEGTITVDGIDIREYSLKSLRDKMGYVPQKAQLFTGTISSNVNFGDLSDSRTEEDVKYAISVAQSTDFVEAEDGAYEAPVSQGGTNFSGGQKQRLSIARAICRKPEIYIFDDSFSALDYRTDRALRSALKKETSGTTSIIVAQRIGTIMDADKIIVMDDGKIVGMGKHRDLLENCPVYSEIALSQLSEKELM